MYKRRAGSFFTIIVLLAISAVAVMNAQFISDFVQYHQYTPNETVASFVAQTGMSEQGKFLFYASQPSLENAETFNKQCGEGEKTAAILGCYDGAKIYIYDITDPRLAGIRPTTAAHEMLHAAYKRLSDKDKQMVDQLLEAEYTKLKENEELTSRMALYAVAQPGDRDNELHSIIGTEVDQISAELESYYKRYFFDRTKVVAQHSQYQSIFAELRNRADTLDNQISQLAEDIKSKKAAYDAQADIMQRDITDFNNRASGGDFESQAEFNVARQDLVARSSSLENLRAEINNDITYYNTLVAELNTIAVETDALNRSIDSSVEPAPSL